MPFVNSGHKMDGSLTPIYRRESAAQDNIFLRSVSAWYNKDVDGPTPFTLSAPSPRIANDQLFVLKCGFGQLLAPPAGWFAFPAYANGNLQVYFRLATNTAADDFALVETTTRNVVAQMAVFGNLLGETGLLNVGQTGTLTNNTGGAGLTAFIMGQMLEDLTPDAHNLAISFYMRERNFGVNAGAATLGGALTLANTIGNIAHNQTASPTGRLFAGWEWEYEDNISPLIPGNASISYTPVEDFSVTTSQMQRMRY